MVSGRLILHLQQSTAVSMWWLVQQAKDGWIVTTDTVHQGWHWMGCASLHRRPFIILNLTDHQPTSLYQSPSCYVIAPAEVICQSIFRPCIDAATDVARSVVCVSVCVLVTMMCCAKKAELDGVKIRGIHSLPGGVIKRVMWPLAKLLFFYFTTKIRPWSTEIQADNTNISPKTRFSHRRQADCTK